MDGRHIVKKTARRIALPLLAISAVAVASTAPSQALAGASSAEYFQSRLSGDTLPRQLSENDRRYYRDVFSAIDAMQWTRVEELLAQRDGGPLHAVAQAEYYLHANSPAIEGPRLAAWLERGVDLPQADRIASLASKRGVGWTPALPREQGFQRQPYATKRILPRGVSDGTMPRETSSAILDRIKTDDPWGAHALLREVEPRLSGSALAEWRQRVAWSYYIENDDASAFALASTVGEGFGAWVAEGDWVAGLAAWRMGDCDQAAQGFSRAAFAAENPELASAAYSWGSRAQVRCRRPELAAEMLRGAAQHDETLYGMLAAEQLGKALPRENATPDFSSSDWQQLRGVTNASVVLALAEIGEDRLADEILRHQARIGDPSQYAALTRLARELGLPETQLWMAHNAPYGGTPDPAMRFPAPRWQPIDGWKVDPALVYAHALQESNFRTAVVSPAGARGLMQIMPAAAKDHSRKLGYTGDASDLNKPQVNLSFGQSHLELLQQSGATGGALPKIMAAYNAGLSPITRWNSEVNDQGDPLLYMESIPYWETRGYVAIVMRNYWMYERQAGDASESRSALAQGQWPGFPAVQQGGGTYRSAAAAD